MRPWEIQPERYAELFDEKCAAVAAQFSELGAPPADRFPSSLDSYRVRAEFRMWHDGSELDYVMFDSEDRRTPIPIADFAPALEPIRKLMPALRQRLRDTAELRRRLFQVEFLAARSGDVVVTLIYHRRLDEHWESEARTLAQDLGVAVVGRSRGQKQVLEVDYVVEHFEVGGRQYGYRQYEQSFVQPNAPVNQQMLQWVWQQAEHCEGDLLELYCGNGNFTLPLADRFSAVVATELSKIGTRAARENLRLNGVENVHIVRLSAEEVSAALRGVREFRRLSALPKPLREFRLDSVFVDPPRAGLDAAALECVAGFRRVFYVSCNPVTLISNLRDLAATHRISALAFFDQFPYTPHLECGVVLEKRDIS
ncbi:MAG: tRNA (uridine(54)-C5)-methyltransferase TrmA [Pseudomonadota bacterium]